MSYTLNLVANGALEHWDAGPVPREMDAQVTNTTIHRLQRSDLLERYEYVQGQNWADIRGRGDRYTYEGEDSLRAEIAAAGAADNFRLFPEGALAALTGASTEHVSIDDKIHHRYAFTVGARCSVDGNLLRVRIVLRDATDAIRLYLGTGGWTATATQLDIGLRTTWRKVGVETPDIPMTDGDGNILENMVWQVSNGTAGAQFLDLDAVTILNLYNSYSSGR